MENPIDLTSIVNPYPSEFHTNWKMLSTPIAQTSLAGDANPRNGDQPSTHRLQSAARTLDQTPGDDVLFAEQLLVLKELGFNEAVVKQALYEKNGNIVEASQMLLEGCYEAENIEPTMGAGSSLDSILSAFSMPKAATPAPVHVNRSRSSISGSGDTPIKAYKSDTQMRPDYANGLEKIKDIERMLQVRKGQRNEENKNATTTSQLDVASKAIREFDESLNAVICEIGESTADALEPAVTAIYSLFSSKSPVDKRRISAKIDDVSKVYSVERQDDQQEHAPTMIENPASLDDGIDFTKDTIVRTPSKLHNVLRPHTLSTTESAPELEDAYKSRSTDIGTPLCELNPLGLSQSAEDGQSEDLYDILGEHVEFSGDGSAKRLPSSGGPTRNSSVTTEQMSKYRNASDITVGDLKFLEEDNLNGMLIASRAGKVSGLNGQRF